MFDVVAGPAADLGARLGVPATSSLGEAFAGAIDAVAICTSTDGHPALIAAAAERGLAVFCEKPISLDLASIDAALTVGGSAGTLLQVGFNRRFDPAHQAVRDHVQRGGVGDLHLVRITSRDPAPPSVDYVARSGGLFCDMTIHDFDMARYVTASEVVVGVRHRRVRVDPAIGAAGTSTPPSWS